MRPRNVHNWEESNTRAGLFESMLDLFTLISFVFILTAILYARQSTSAADYVADVTSVSTAGSGVARTIPKDVVLLLFHQGDLGSQLTLADGATGFRTNSPIVVGRVRETLNLFQPMLTRGGKLNIGFYKRPRPLPDSIVAEVLEWLATQKEPKAKFYIVGDQ